MENMIPSFYRNPEHADRASDNSFLHRDMMNRRSTNDVGAWK